MVDPLTLCSLRVECRANGNSLGPATGFVVERSARKYLITNWHVLAGRHADTDKPLSDTAAIPDEITIVHHIVFEDEGRRATGWFPVTQPLVQDEKRLWLQHQKGRDVDVAALELALPDPRIVIYPLDLAWAEADMFVGVGEAVKVVGYPLGL